MTRAFTLIELLVVITIIVVLLALLTPALDRAIYQAELASCGGRQKAVAAGIISYAFDQRRYYPYREAVRHPNTGVWPEWITIPPTQGSVNKSGGGFDDRPMLRPYIKINSFNDPLNTQVDYDAATDLQGASTGTVMWAGWVYKDAGTTFSLDLPTGNTVGTGTGTGFKYRTQGMFRVGDKWTWINDNAPVFESSILYSDYLFMGNFFGWLNYSSHPDTAGVLNPLVRHPWQSPQEQTNAAVENFVHASWRGGLTPGKYDMNFARADGSVLRFNDVPPDPRNDSANRFERVGIAQGATDTNLYWLVLPRD